jgi:hypothetical protein
MSLIVGDADSGTGLAGALFAQLRVLDGARLDTPPPSHMAQYCNALARAIVPYIVGSTIVLPTALVAPNGGGPVTGTGTII